jgi:hypothetical protein
MERLIISARGEGEGQTLLSSVPTEQAPEQHRSRKPKSETVVDADEAAEIDSILEHCGFTDQARRTDIAADGFDAHDHVNAWTEKDVGSLAKGFADRTQANGKMIFGLRRTDPLKATAHWAQDFRRIGRVPKLDEIADQADFRAALETARLRAQTRRHNAEESDSLSKAADPGKLKRQKEWSQELLVCHSWTEQCPPVLHREGRRSAKLRTGDRAGL